MDKLNSIIYAYQDIWDKYAVLYQYKAIYYYKKSLNTNDREDYNEYIKNLLLILENLDKSLNANYLNIDNHILKICILPVFNNKKQHIESIKDCFITKIFVDFAKPDQILKEQINITFGKSNDLKISLDEKKRKIYDFTISTRDIDELSNQIYNPNINPDDYNKINKTVNKKCDEILKALYQKNR